MTVFIFLLLLNFIKLGLGSPFSNNSKLSIYSDENAFNGNEPAALRHKRYNRWGANNDQSNPEFLVQIFDEDLPASENPSSGDDALLNLNIIPFENRPGKLQLGSVMMPTRTPLPTESAMVPVVDSMNYTRFAPPRGYGALLMAGAVVTPVSIVKPQLSNTFEVSDSSDDLFPRLLSSIPNNVNPEMDKTAPEKLVADSPKLEMEFSEDEGESDDDTVMLNIDRVPSYSIEKPTMRALQYIAVSPPPNEYASFTIDSARSSKHSILKPAAVPALRSTRLSRKKTTVNPKRYQTKIDNRVMHQSTILHHVNKFPTRSTRLFPGVFDVDDDSQADSDKRIDKGDNTEFDAKDKDADYEGGDGMKIEEESKNKNNGNHKFTIATQSSDINDNHENDYENNDKEKYSDKLDHVNRPPTRSIIKSITPNNDYDDETEENERINTPNNLNVDNHKSSISYRTSEKIDWGGYDDEKEIPDINTPGFSKQPYHNIKTTASRDQGRSDDSKGSNKIEVISDKETFPVKNNNDKEKKSQNKNHNSNKINGFHKKTTAKNNNKKDNIAVDMGNSNDTENGNSKKPESLDTSGSGFSSTTSKLPETLNGKTPSIPIFSTTPKLETLPPHGSCSIEELEPFTFHSHHKLAEVMLQLKRWSKKPVAKLVDISNGSLTFMGNSIQMVIVDDRSHGQDSFAKQTVLVVAGIQGRDHDAVSAAMYLLFELIERAEHHMDLLSQFRFWVIPVFNPDGYEYSTTFPDARDWKKNMKQSWEARESCASHGIRCVLRDCRGVHLDRNFEYQWISDVEMHPVHPCGRLYPGERQLSEPETQAFTQHLQAAAAAPLHAFLAIKEDRLRGVLYPYSHTKNPRASDETHRLRARNGAKAAESIAGRKYVFGQVSEFLPLYAGGIEDWMEGHQGVDNSYTVMMDDRPSNITIEEVCKEVFAAVDTMLLTKSPPLVLMYHSSLSTAPRPLCWRPTFPHILNVLVQMSVCCLYFLLFFFVASFLRIVESTP